MDEVEMIQRRVNSLLLDPAVAHALMKIQHDIALLIEKVDAIERSMQPGNWDDDDGPIDNPPF
jgi:hypothetical protein